MTRQEAYAKMLSEAPEMAEWLSAVAAEFGRPEAIRIDFADGERFEHGYLAPEGNTIRHRHQSGAEAAPSAAGKIRGNRHG